MIFFKINSQQEVRGRKTKIHRQTVRKDFADT
jgi:hypothetical protein